MFHENTGLVYSIIRRFLGRGTDMEDLYQIGCIGLLKAIDHFDTSFDVRFSTYAVPMITGELKRFFRDDGMIKISRSLKENYCKIQKMRSVLEEKLGREPNAIELCRELGMDMDEFLLSLETDHSVESLHKVIYQSDGSEISLMDKIPEKENGQEQILNRIYLEEMLSVLSKEEQKLISMRYYQDKTQVEVAETMGISQVQVSRLEKKILKKMRETAEEKRK